jgi:cellulose synthase/poly-beta-1,6-N-acetylglucosamine synthase-like glycosyltransferase
VEPRLFGLVTGLLYLLMTYRLTLRTSPPPLTNVSVDVFIPTYNESVDLVRRTLVAAKNIEYPHNTWLLDAAWQGGWAEVTSGLQWLIMLLRVRFAMRATLCAGIAAFGREFRLRVAVRFRHKGPIGHDTLSQPVILPRITNFSRSSP